MDKRVVEIVAELRGIVAQQQKQVYAVSDRLAELEELFGDDNVTLPTVTPYSQNDPRWANEVYSGGYTFARAGCYVTCVAMVASLDGYRWTPPDVAGAMLTTGCFVGGELLHPERIPSALPGLVWPHGAYYNRAGNQMLNHKLDLIREFIDKFGAMIIKVDYKPENYKFNMHFVLAVAHTPDDFEIIDPLDGKRVSLLERYGASRGWGAAQAIFGYRALRVAE